jgi:16S rRNA (guanine527-N7)-methyltransferase
VEHLAHCSALLKQYSDEIGIHLRPEQLNQFEIYLEQLKIWNRSVNLTSITDDKEIVIKHFVDSLAGLTAGDVPAGARLLDIGTGAGFPGIPLKIARSDLRLTLVEPVQKKVSFLYSMVGLLRLKDVKIFFGTYEKFARESDLVGEFDYITTRALKSDVILRGERDMLAGEGKAILYLSHPQSEVIEGWSIIKQHAFDLPCGFGSRVVAVLGKSKR